ncbi:Ring finger domain/Zinc finger, C3HC4 type (RING finger)/PHD-finger containing protein [Novymonas esmeraldas]|uniref:Ring finger domain/Zinc finger, C3HC4 type (RING finger)/PHD-finger containing protein n=1 Tax=Novymonas esmeraldas TaxID=1808958 RepID=A0AAW0F5D7_9TRYP
MNSPGSPVSTSSGPETRADGSASSTPNTATVTLVESAAAYENICAICFTDIHAVHNPRGRLNSCDHLFCSLCIKEWAKNTNVCPSCKARFTRIYTCDPDTNKEEETKVRKRNYVAWETTYYENEAGDEDDAIGQEALLSSVVCDVCQQSENAVRMIFCDRRQCNYAAHLDCLGMTERPLTFLCAACTELRKREDDDATPLASSVAAAAALADANRPPRQPTPPSPPPPPPTGLVVAPAEVIPSRVVRQRNSAPASSPSAPATSDGVQVDRVDRHPHVSRTTRPAPGVAASRTATRRAAPRLAAEHRTTPPSPPPPPPRAEPLGPIDFSKPHVASPVEPGMAAEAEPDACGEGVGSDDYYFLAPTSHAVAATIGLARAKEMNAVAAQVRWQRGRAVTERLHAPHGAHRGERHLDRTGKRARRSGAEEAAAELAVAEAEFLDPQRRRVLEERMVRRWAADMLPVLRRRRYVEGDTVTTEDDLWTQAVAQARAMVREKLEAKSASLRNRREQFVRAQAQREAAALAKLARVIAQHRARNQQAAQATLPT